LLGKQKSKKEDSLLASSHGKEICPMFQENLDNDCEITSIFKSSAPFANVTEDLRKLGNNLSKRDHIKMGGPGKNLNRNYHYSIEKSINFIAEKSNNRNVGFVNLFWRHDKPWINRKVRSVNLRLDQALMVGGNSHHHVIEIPSFQREDFMNHGLHLNSLGKKKLTLLIAKCLGDKLCHLLAIHLLSPVQKLPLA